MGDREFVKHVDAHPIQGNHGSWVSAPVRLFFFCLVHRATHHTFEYAQRTLDVRLHCYTLYVDAKRKVLWTNIFNMPTSIVQARPSTVVLCMQTNRETSRNPGIAGNIGSCMFLFEKPALKPNRLWYLERVSSISAYPAEPTNDDWTDDCSLSDA